MCYEVNNSTNWLLGSVPDTLTRDVLARALPRQHVNLYRAHEGARWTTCSRYTCIGTRGSSGAPRCETHLSVVHIYSSLWVPPGIQTRGWRSRPQPPLPLPQAATAAPTAKWSIASAPLRRGHCVRWSLSAPHEVASPSITIRTSHARASADGEDGRGAMGEDGGRHPAFMVHLPAT